MSFYVYTFEIKFMRLKGQMTSENAFLLARKKEQHRLPNQSKIHIICEQFNI